METIMKYDKLCNTIVNLRLMDRRKMNELGCMDWDMASRLVKEWHGA